MCDVLRKLFSGFLVLFESKFLVVSCLFVVYFFIIKDVGERFFDFIDNCKGDLIDMSDCEGCWKNNYVMK